jgi:two-component sensor histidine kinase
LSHLAEVAELVVSELITNSIKHAGGIIDPPADYPATLLAMAPPVILKLHFRDSLLIEVWDQSDVPPHRREAADDAVDGRGLELIEMLSKDWGYYIHPTGGKIIWCSLDASLPDETN